MKKKSPGFSIEKYYKNEGCFYKEFFAREFAKKSSNNRKKCSFVFFLDVKCFTNVRLSIK